MRTERISDIDFQGKLNRTRKIFSAKPQQSLANAEKPINDVLKSKPFDVYVYQDYSTHEIVFQTDHAGIESRIPVTSRTSKYIEAAQNVISQHENAESAAMKAEWIEEQNKSEFRDICLSLLYFAALPFMYMAAELKDEAKELKMNFNKLAKKLATKKG